MSATDRLAQRLVALHESGQLHYGKLADETGIHRVTLSNIIRRRQEDVSFNLVARLAAAANISLDEIVDATPAISK